MVCVHVLYCTFLLHIHGSGALLEDIVIHLQQIWKGKLCRLSIESHFIFSFCEI